MSTPAAPPTKRRQQLVQAYKMARKTDSRLLIWIIAAFVVFGALGFLLLSFIPGPDTLRIVLSVIGAILFGVIGALAVFGRRAQKAAFLQMEGQKGASVAALSTLRRGWKVNQMPVAFNKQQDLVFRVVGPPGIVLVGEGSGARIKQLLASEKRNHERVLSETPIHEVILGNGAGEVPLPKLVRHVTKLGRNVKPAQMTDILNRLKALDANRSAVPIPKGPVPTSMKGQRGNTKGR
ncbi:DUF4191 domain-containing protein [Nocardioides cavernaquae]|uniref:DUF4191 domain-containing protein n=1 Tax=Nocardioides cavernaquae TaxID=2321396 RepID=A0A3A5HIH9_9ACTN|nr:DUF4191 domain-containing protein [Nocardioides cavernaquae]RJS47537.1 DUF4191 domain-containing protein [Nocardioides cavernaquae]